MILARDGRTEQRHDAVTLDAIDQPLVAVNRCHHCVDRWSKSLDGFLSIELADQGRRPGNVSEQNCNLLALSFPGSARRENLLGEVDRGVTIWGRNVRLMPTRGVVANTFPMSKSVDPEFLEFAVSERRHLIEFDGIFLERVCVPFEVL